MNSPGSPALRNLPSLDTSLSDFDTQLSNILHGEEYEQCAPRLEDDDLVWLAGYLDKVRRFIALSYSPLKSE
jgi:hypothetical protein